MLGLQACTGQRIAPAAPEGSYELVAVPGYPTNIRFFGDQTPPQLNQMVSTIQQQIDERVRREGLVPNGGAADVLTLSGGGPDGAYGAGLLNGWSMRGGRPEFQLVTGISTGSLIAPLAFVGPSQNCKLERLYTNLSTDDILVQAVADAIFGNRLGLTDSSALGERISEVLDDRMISRIADEHAKGRRLWIGTTNMDAQRPVVWDIGAIASSGNPGKRKLIRDILLASASIPGVFPPVEIIVESPEGRFAELHLDGGVTRQIFFLPVQVKLSETNLSEQGALKPGTVYALRNTKLAASYEAVPASLLDITSRAISTLIRAAGVADIFVIKLQAQENGFGLQVTSVPEDFDAPEEELFDPEYMRQLYQVGLKRGLGEDAWREEVASINRPRNRTAPQGTESCDAPELADPLEEFREGLKRPDS